MKKLFSKLEYLAFKRERQFVIGSESSDSSDANKPQKRALKVEEESSVKSLNEDEFTITAPEHPKSESIEGPVNETEPANKFRPQVTFVDLDPVSDIRTRLKKKHRYASRNPEIYVTADTV